MKRTNLTIPLDFHNCIIGPHEYDLPYTTEDDWCKIPNNRIEITSVDRYPVRIWLREEIVDFLNATDPLWYIDLRFDMIHDKYGVPYSRKTVCLKYSSLEDNAVMLKLML